MLRHVSLISVTLNYLSKGLMPANTTVKTTLGKCCVNVEAYIEIVHIRVCIHACPHLPFPPTLFQTIMFYKPVPLLLLAVVLKHLKKEIK